MPLANAVLRSAIASGSATMRPHSFALLAYGLKVRGGGHEFSKCREWKEWPPKCPTDGKGQPANSWRLYVADVMLLTDNGANPHSQPSFRDSTPGAKDLRQGACRVVAALAGPRRTLPP